MSGFLDLGCRVYVVAGVYSGGLKMLWFQGLGVSVPLLKTGMEPHKDLLLRGLHTV